jgi:hypothetical protein
MQVLCAEIVMPNDHLACAILARPSQQLNRSRLADDHDMIARRRGPRIRSDYRAWSDRCGERRLSLAIRRRRERGVTRIGAAK